MQKLQAQGVLFHKRNGDAQWTECFLSLRTTQRLGASTGEGGRRVEWMMALVKGPVDRRGSIAKLERSDDWIFCSDIDAIGPYVLSSESYKDICVTRNRHRDDALAAGFVFPEFEQTVNPCGFQIQSVSGSVWELAAPSYAARSRWIASVKRAQEAMVLWTKSSDIVYAPSSEPSHSPSPRFSSGFKPVHPPTQDPSLHSNGNPLPHPPPSYTAFDQVGQRRLDEERWEQGRGVGEGDREEEVGGKHAMPVPGERMPVPSPSPEPRSSRATPPSSPSPRFTSPRVLAHSPFDVSKR